MGNLTGTLVYQGKLRCCSHKKHVKGPFLGHGQRGFLGHVGTYYQGVLWLRMVALLTRLENLEQERIGHKISSLLVSPAEIQAQSHFKSLCSWLKIHPPMLQQFGNLWIYEFQSEFLNSLYIFFYSDGSLLVFKRLPERPALESACKHSSGQAGWETRVQHISRQKGKAQVWL